MLDQIKRYWIYVVSALIAVVMILLSLTVEDWTIERQLELVGKLVALITTLIAVKFSNPKNVDVQPKDDGVAQDILPTPEELIEGTDDTGEIIEGPVEMRG